MTKIEKLILKYERNVAELNKDLITFGYLEEKEAYNISLGEKNAYASIIQDLKEIILSNAKSLRQ